MGCMLHGSFGRSQNRQYSYSSWHSEGPQTFAHGARLCFVGAWSLTVFVLRGWFFSKGSKVTKTEANTCDKLCTR